MFTITILDLSAIFFEFRQFSKFIWAIMGQNLNYRNHSGFLKMNQQASDFLHLEFVRFAFARHQPTAPIICSHRRVTTKGNGLQFIVPALTYRLV